MAAAQAPDPRDRVIRPPVERDMFNGLEPRVPALDRRLFLGLGAAVIGLAGGGAYALGASMDGPGAGSWDMGTVLTLEGRIVIDPYPRLLTEAFAPLTQTALLVCPTKCTPGPAIEDRPGARVRLKGTLLKRGRDHMIAVGQAPDDVEVLDPAPAPHVPVVEDLGVAELVGEILDAKCWFGAMRPGAGKPHKSCASLCLRMGVPPAFYARGAVGREHALVMTDPDGGRLDERLYALVADPVRARGRLLRVDGAPHLRLDLGDVVRI